MLRQLLLTLFQAVEEPFIQNLSATVQSIAGGVVSIDANHPGTQSLAINEAPAADGAGAVNSGTESFPVASAAGSRKVVRQHHVSRARVTTTVDTLVLNITLLNGLPAGPGRLIGSENHNDIQKWLDEIAANRTCVHGANCGQPAVLSTDTTQRDAAKRT